MLVSTPQSLQIGVRSEEMPNVILVEPPPGWAADVTGPGVHAVVFTDDRGSLEGRRQGLELRDTILVLSAKRCRYAFVFRVPLEEGTLADQMMVSGAGALNIGACRVSYVSEADKTPIVGKGKPGLNPGCGPTLPSRKENWGAWEVNNAGRWPSNVVLVHGEGCQVTGTKRVAATSMHGSGVAIRRSGVHSAAGGHQTIGREQPVMRYANDDGTETSTAWSCVSECPARILDDQTGERPSTLTGRADPDKIHENPGDNHGSSLFGGGNSNVYADSGGGSRFYPQFKDDEELLTWLRRLIQAS